MADGHLRRIQAVIFDLDGVLVDSESVWADVRRQFTLRQGGQWRPDAQRMMMGMSSVEWSEFMQADLAVPLEPAAIVAGVVEMMLARYRERLPLFPGAVEVVRDLSSRWPLGLASSANRPLIDLVLERSGLRGRFSATLSTEEVGRGKPAPDVYLEVARRLGVEPQRCAGVEDSTNGLRALMTAGMRVIAVPNHDFPPDPEVLAAADVVVSDLGFLTFGVIEGAA